MNNGKAGYFEKLGQKNSFAAYGPEMMESSTYSDLAAASGKLYRAAEYLVTRPEMANLEAAGILLGLSYIQRPQAVK